MRSRCSSVLSATVRRVIESVPTSTIGMIADHVAPETDSAIVELNGATTRTVALLRTPHR